VVVGQQLMQGTSDIFLGWTTGPGGRDFYFRQLWDMKGSVDTATLQPPGMGFYGALCGRALARAHARTGDAVAISSYLGTSDTFDGAIADFAEAYADVNARDHAAYLAAIDAGRVTVPQG
jgi:predicted alpha/beta hydrolase